MILTNKQIEYLFDFCRQHFVQYYDVQVELVDHLANAVEVEMVADDKLSFEKAVEKIHRSFGVMGFAPLVAEKQKIAKKQSRKLFWNIFKNQFHWPKIITFFLLCAFMFTLFSVKLFLIKWFYVAIMIGSLGMLFPLFILQRIVANTGKKFLIINFSWISSLVFLPTNLLNISRLFKDQSFLEYTTSNFLILGMSIFLSLFIITLIAVWQTLSSVKSTLYQNYPEVFTYEKIY